LEGPDGRELDTITVHCDQEGARFLLEWLREIEELAKSEMPSVIAVQFATSRPNDPDSAATS
jgi:hypothetical protein